jgi:hypothetical protein
MRFPLLTFWPRRIGIAFQHCQKRLSPTTSAKPLSRPLRKRCVFVVAPRVPVELPPAWAATAATALPSRRWRPNAGVQVNVSSAGCARVRQRQAQPGEITESSGVAEDLDDAVADVDGNDSALAWRYHTDR